MVQKRPHRQRHARPVDQRKAQVQAAHRPAQRHMAQPPAIGGKPLYALALDLPADRLERILGANAAAVFGLG